MSVQINPKGTRQYDHSIRARISDSSMFAMEKLLGDQHCTDLDNKKSAEWYLVTDHGSITVHNWWDLAEGNYVIQAANDRAALIAVDYFKQHGMQSHMLRNMINDDADRTKEALTGELRDAWIIQLARDKYEDEGTIEIDNIEDIHCHELISEGGDNGCYVKAWVWVDFSETVLDKETIE